MVLVRVNTEDGMGLLTLEFYKPVMFNGWIVERSSLDEEKDRMS